MEVGTKVRAELAILAFQSEADAVSQHGLQLIKVAAYDIQFIVRNQACEMLSDSSLHPSRLPVIHPEPLFLEDGRNAHSEAFDAFLEIFIP